NPEGLPPSSDVDAVDGSVIRDESPLPSWLACHTSTCSCSISSIRIRIAFPAARSSSRSSAERPVPQLRSVSSFSSSRRPRTSGQPSPAEGECHHPAAGSELDLGSVRGNRTRLPEGITRVESNRSRSPEGRELRGHAAFLRAYGLLAS